jgi:hypothetical protein
LEIHEYIVVGSGCTGAMAAQTLIEKGVKVTMLDVGVTDNKYLHLIPDKDFISIRKTETGQHRYFTGDEAEGIPWGKVKTGEHLTPPRKHITQLVDKYLPIDSNTFFPMESLSYGGLGSGWGLGCCEFSKQELQTIGLDPNRIEEAYNTVAGRIGINGAKDDASPYTVGDLNNYQQAPILDRNHQLLFKKYTANKKQLNADGFYLGRPALALLTEDLGERKKYAYRDMDFYSDLGQSAYRPWITINELKKKNNFNYVPNHLVTDFSEQGGQIEVHCINIITNAPATFKCKKLILAPGVLGTARIVMRSLKKENAKLPLLCNPYTYIPCIQPAMMGKEAEQRKIGFAQLSLFHDEQHTNFNVAMASIYSYQSLMLFRIVKEAPLNFVDARIIMRYLMSGIIIMGIHHPEEKSRSKYLELIQDDDSITHDKLKATYIIGNEENRKIDEREKKYTRTMRRLGAYAIKRIRPGNGSSIHYAGTLPFSKTGETFTLSPSGKLNGTQNIYVADGSGFNYLPAKGLTFSLMANAHLTALNALKNE